jgi:hypothetical protein
VIKAGREMVIRRFREAGVCDDVESLIQHEFIITPPEWGQRYNLMHGAVFGLAHGVFQLACFRPPVQSGIPGWPDSPKIDNLYFVGASTRPGAPKGSAAIQPQRSLGGRLTDIARERPEKDSRLVRWTGLAVLTTTPCMSICSAPAAGNGVPLVMMGVNTTVENILKDSADSGAAAGAASVEAKQPSGAVSAR